MRVSEYRVSSLAERLWRIAVLTAAGTIGATSQAEAAIYYWPYSDPGYSQPRRRSRSGGKSTHHQPRPKRPWSRKGSAKPQGPLIIAISIEKQKLKIYDANGFFAETPISTGMRGHSTPMGVFSVIQKQKYAPFQHL